MTAIWMRARAELRAGWRAWVALAIMLGLFASVVLATAAGARRTKSALPRFMQNLDAADAFVGNVLNERLQGAIEHLPQVRTFGRVSFMLTAPKLPDGTVGTAFGVNTIAPVDGKWMKAFDRAHVLTGRMPDPADANEVLVNEAFAETRKVGVGDVVTMVAYAPEQLGPIFNGEPVTPSGPTMRLTVVGIGRIARDLAIGSDVSADATVVASDAWYHERANTVANFGVNDMVQLKSSSDIDTFRRDAERLYREMRAPGDELQIESVNDVLSPSRDALAVQATALWLFAAAAALAIVLVLGQAIARRVALSGDDAFALASLGMSRRARFISALIPVALVAAAAGIVSVGGSFLASAFFPTGFARLVEGSPGMRADWAVAASGAVLVVVVVLVRVAPAAWLAMRHRVSEGASGRASKVTLAVARAGGSAPSVAGVRMALEPGRGKTAIPVRAAFVSATIGLAAMAAAFTIGSSLQHVIDTPRLYGWNWDVAIAGPEDASLVPKLVRRIAATSVVGDFATVTLADVRVNGRTTQGLEFTPIRGHVFLGLAEGREPRDAAEVVLGAETMRDLHAKMGDKVRVGGQDEGETSVPMTVVGRAVFAGIDDDELDDGIGLTTGALNRVYGEVRSSADDASDFVDVVARYRPGVDKTRAFAQLRAEFGETNAFKPARPPEVDNLRRVSAVPRLLGLLIILMSIATIAHVLATTSRRRARDISILKTLGFVRRQVRSVLGWQATTFAVVSLLVGLPLGIAGGRLGWMVLADRLGVPLEFASPTVALALAIPIAIMVVNLVSAIPARAAARTRPATVLRAE